MLDDLYQRWGRLGFWAKHLHQKFSVGRKKYNGGIAAAERERDRIFQESAEVDYDAQLPRRATGHGRELSGDRWRFGELHIHAEPNGDAVRFLRRPKVLVGVENQQP